jgi:hypothetical protein
MRSRPVVVSVAATLIVLGCGKKEKAIDEQKLVVPAGCKLTVTAPGGHIECADDNASFAWLPLSDSTPDQALDKGEGIITDAMSGTEIKKSSVPCTVAGQAMTCRRLDMKMKEGTLVALLAAGPLRGTPYYVECSYMAGAKIHAVCNDFFKLP